MSECIPKLQELRTQKGIPQKEIADYLGITIASYSLYERGNREPNIAMIKHIARYYKISLDDLLDFKL